MIAYTLCCDAGHEFESWFASSAAYDTQAKRGLVSCPLCGSAKVGKAIMAPSVARTDKGPRQGGEAPSATPAAEPERPDERPMAMLGERERQLRDMIRALRKHVAENADYVGPRFPEEARQMHNGEIEHRSIWGEASAEEAKALAEEGVEVQALPMLPNDRN
ncbi:hypothetical protein SAMN05519104_2789 [Rhizobiales bacterium GAS188]|nr:hypothetical protein SAMN05519104_2789 [Rhizobiales bacterium GAS188]